MDSESLGMKIEKISPQDGDIIIVTTETMLNDGARRQLLRELETLAEFMRDRQINIVLLPPGYEMKLATKEDVEKIFPNVPWGELHSRDSVVMKQAE